MRGSRSDHVSERDDYGTRYRPRSQPQHSSEWVVKIRRNYGVRAQTINQH